MDIDDGKSERYLICEVKVLWAQCEPMDRDDVGAVLQIFSS